VEVTLEDGSREKGDYLIGADGAGSAVRRAIGVEFEGMTFPERFFVVSTPFDFAAALDRLCYVNYIADTEEFCVLLRVPGLWRCLFPTQDESDEEVLASAQKKLQGVHRRREPYETVHHTLYRVHQKVAAKYRAGRVFLAGDAAHINNPLGGMGMNGGLHDALNLCEKLVRGADLDRYEAERRPIAIEYINANTARNRKLMAERDPEARRRAQDEMCRIAADPAAAKAFLMKSSMIDALRALPA
jgi:3-(3-hydroxy-phenyl)propionate hydroxylase